MSAVGLASEAVKQLQADRAVVAQAAGRPTPANPPETAASVDSALSALTTYIPAEATALYLAFTSSLPLITKDYPRLNGHLSYWVFTFGISPGLFLLAYFAKLARANEPIPDWKQFPWFRLVSSIVAFAAWALCIPGNPFANSSKPGSGILFGLMAMTLSIVLPSTEAIYDWLRKQRSV